MFSSTLPMFKLGGCFAQFMTHNWAWLCPVGVVRGPIPGLAKAGYVHNSKQK